MLKFISYKDTKMKSEYSKLPVKSNDYHNTEIVIGLVNPVGADSKLFLTAITERLRVYNYRVEVIKVSSNVIKQLTQNDMNYSSEYDRISKYMDLGNELRESTTQNAILALGITSEIYKCRNKDEKNNSKPMGRIAYIIDSLKHPDEVEKLREIYTNGFYLFGIFSDEQRRLRHLINDKRMNEEQAQLLIERDSDENFGHGQHTRDAFELCDFFLALDNNFDKFKNSLWRILDLIFGSPYLTPTFDEYAMFMAFTSSLRSADLSRQVGAVIAKNNEIIATGANDSPKAGGGLYWPVYDEQNHEIIDKSEGRDYKRGHDSNKFEQQDIIQNILNNLDDTFDKDQKGLLENILKKSRIKDITEYGRVVHAEMEALLFCARNSISAKGATLYCTTFPCHNCAKHIITAGLKKVVYIEPYPKSKAFDFHSDSIINNEKEFLPSEENANHVNFVPFIGVGPRKFFDLFSMNLSSGYKVKRKKSDGSIVDWEPERSYSRLQMLPFSYMEKELIATTDFYNYLGEEDGKK